MQDYKTLYNDFYTAHPVDIHDDPIRHKKISELCKGSVLDLGCGTGSLSDYFKGKYTGLDVSDLAISQAKESRRQDAEFDIVNLSKLDFPKENKFDTVVLAEVLEHLDEGDLNIEHVISYLNPKGRLIISVPLLDRVPDVTHVQEFSIPKLRQIFSEYGYVKFHKWSGDNARIIMTCDVGVKNPKRMSLNIIAKNEGLGLENCIMSAVDLVDQVVVAVDDASDDNTLEVAKKFADVVKTFKWENDFSGARNFADSLSSCEWVLSLDGHEFVDKTNNLDQELMGDYEALYCRCTYENGLSVRQPRIYRHGVIWRDKVHNSLQAKRLNKSVVLKFIHDRQRLQSKEAIEKRTEQRKKMISEIMGDRIAKNPRDARAMFYLAINYQTLEQFTKAIKTFKKYLKIGVDVEQKWYAVFNLTLCYMHRGNFIRSFYWAQRTEKYLSSRWENARLCALILLHFGKYEEALPYLVASMNDNEKQHSYYPIQRNTGEVFDMLGLCFFNLRQFEKAYRAWKRALELVKEEKTIAMLKGRIKLLTELVDKEKLKIINQEIK